MAKNAQDEKLSRLELITINNKNHEKFDNVLKDAQQFLSQNYPSDEVLSYKHAKQELSDAANEAYTWAVARQKDGKVVGAVVYDVWPVPRSPIDKKIVSDGRNDYTLLFYVTAANGYEKALTPLLEGAKKTALSYSERKGKNNAGMLTNDLRHKEAIKEAGGIQLGEIGVPTLEDISDEDYLTKNFQAARKEALMYIPFGKGWTKSRVKRAVASYLEQGYNEKKPGEVGYKPLTKAPYFTEFAEHVDGSGEGRYFNPKPAKQ